MHDAPPRHPALPLPETVDALPAEALPAFVVGLAALQARAAARLLAGAQNGGPPPDRLLTVEEVAARTGLSKDNLYRRAAARSLPFARRVGRSVRFSEHGLSEWMARRPR